MIGQATDQPREWCLVECLDAFRDEHGRRSEHKVPASDLAALMTRDEALAVLEETERRSPGRSYSIRRVTPVSSLASDVPLTGSRA